jgi:hypothetical protein
MSNEPPLENPPASNRTLAPSNASPQVTRAEFAKALAHLAALKRTTEFTDLQILAWYNGLSAFPIWIINRSVLRLATSQERFTEFGDVYQLCRREAICAGLLKEPFARAGNEEKILPLRDIESLGNAMGLQVKP